jgi:MSHA biogenesis protein MshL
MAEIRIKYAHKFLLISCLSLFLSSCAYMDNLLDIKREIQIPKEATTVTPADKAPAPLKTPDFIPVHEDASPIKTRIVDLSARNTPLRDVLFIIADATGLNLVMDKEVNPEIPVTLTLKNVTAEDALSKVFSSVDYFYTIKDNMLYVKVTDTRIYELGHPAVIQTYSTDLGGDMLGAAMSTTGGGSHLKGSIAQKTESDKSAYNFWEVIEKSIEKTLAASGEVSASIQQAFTVNRLTGTIVVTGTKNNLDKVENYINTIKKVINRQVIVEAKVIEVSLSDSLQFGIDWNAVITYGASRSGSIRTTSFANVVPSPGPVFVASTATTGDFNALLNALQIQGETRILSNPRVNVMNGQTALLSVGKNVSFISSVQTTTTAVSGAASTITFSISTGNVLSGIMIGLVPFINESGEISLTITPIVSDLIELKDEKFGTPDTTTDPPTYPYRIQLPTIDLKQLSTTVKVRSGHMIVIGGLISKKEQLTDSKVPGLGDIPILGYFFKSRSKSVKNTELVVLLQPVIVSR